MNQATLDMFRQLVYDQAGIALGERKDALIHARLAKRLRALNLSTYEDYLEYVQSDPTGREVISLLDVVCTNVTSFFREPAHFEFTASAVEQWLAQGQRKFRIWSCACSTGEEVYSLAMTVLEAARGIPIDLKILATDLSTTALRHCAAGVYEERKMEGVSQDLRARYFVRENSGDVVRYRVREHLQDMLIVRRLNLAEPPFPLNGPVDVVFCRNVMIYFDDPVRRRLLEETYRVLRPGGYLMVGHAESLTGMMSRLRHVAPGVYSRR